MQTLWRVSDKSGENKGQWFKLVQKTGLKSEIMHACIICSQKDNDKDVSESAF
jgi:hypothetical protein